MRGSTPPPPSYEQVISNNFNRGAIKEERLPYYHFNVHEREEEEEEGSYSRAAAALVTVIQECVALTTFTCTAYIIIIVLCFGLGSTLWRAFFRSDYEAYARSKNITCLLSNATM